MAIALKRFSQSSRKYPWSQWMDGTVYRAESGADFTCTIKGFLSSLYNRAERKSRTVEARVIDGKYVEFQFDEPPKLKPVRKTAKRKPRK
jgi:hypothetical protein